MLALGRWGSVAPFPPAEDARIGVDAFVIALKTLYGGGGSGRFSLVLDGEPFTVVADGTLEAARGEARDPDGVISGAPGELAAVLWHGRALESTGIELSGRAAEFLELFPLPQG